jgi:hypothetical protein
MYNPYRSFGGGIAEERRGCVINCNVVVDINNRIDPSGYIQNNNVFHSSVARKSQGIESVIGQTDFGCSQVMSLCEFVNR